MEINNNYNPDVLTCLANLSNDEVFTPSLTRLFTIFSILPKYIAESAARRRRGGGRAS